MITRTLIAAALIAGAGSAAAQDNYYDWAQAGQPPLESTPTAPASTNRGGLTIYADRSSFDAAGGASLPLETFDGGTIDGGPINCGAVIDSATASPCFAVGDVIDGFQITATGGTSDDLIGLPGGFLGAGQATDVVGANSFADVTVIDFSPAVPAIGMDIYVGAPGPGDVTIEAFDGGGASVGSFTVTTTALDQPEFAGFVSPTPVAQVVITGVGDSGELLDDLAFGSTLPQATEVPTLGIAGILLLLVAIGIGGLLARRSLRAS